MTDLEILLNEIGAAREKRQEQQDWQPPLSGDIDIRIAADGSWHHQGTPILRDRLVRLFAGVLRREGAEYFLVTPVEKWRIRVDDAPFVAGLVEQVEINGLAAIVFTTNMEQRVIVDREHPVRLVESADAASARAYVDCGDGLEALIVRGAFYEMMELAEERVIDGRRCLVMVSMGVEFELGCF